VRCQLDEQSLAAIEIAGRTMNYEQVLEYALAV
jgi:hypothetical protein